MIFFLHWFPNASVQNMPGVVVAVSRKWSVPDMVVSVAKPEARTGLSVVHSPMARCLYIYGGSKNRKWFSDVYMVDTDNWTWQCIKVSRSAECSNSV